MDFLDEMLKNTGIWGEIIKKHFINELTQILAKINLQKATPKPENISAALKYFDPMQTKVVLMGEAPISAKGAAMGLSFSSNILFAPRLETLNIYRCLQHHGIISEIPHHGDLSAWAKQGVLMLNINLTTPEGAKSRAHNWENFTTKLLDFVPQDAVFILLGDKVRAPKQSKHILRWSHPSPFLIENKTENPQHFKYCDVFVEANKILAARGQVIDWAIKPFIYPVNKTNIPWIFVDGGIKGNGKETAVGSWAYLIITKNKVMSDSGLITENATNIRAELIAIKMGVERAIAENILGIIYSDSEISITILTQYYANWLKNGDTDNKKNLDLIADLAPKTKPFVFEHVNSHRIAFDYKTIGNCIVDQMCAAKLGR